MNNIVIVDLSSSKVHFKGLNWISNLDHGWKGIYILPDFFKRSENWFEICKGSWENLVVCISSRSIH